MNKTKKSFWISPWSAVLLIFFSIVLVRGCGDEDAPLPETSVIQYRIGIAYDLDDSARELQAQWLKDMSNKGSAHGELYNSSLQLFGTQEEMLFIDYKGGKTSIFKWSELSPEEQEVFIALGGHIPSSDE